MSYSSSPVRDDTFDPSTSEALTARVIEVGDVTAGIAVPEHGGVRFYSSERSFDALDGTLFRSIEQVARVARERKRGGDLVFRNGAARLRAVG